MTSKHPYQPFIPTGATKLIIGTIPPARFCSEPPALEEGDVPFYYGSRDNAFWELIGKSVGENMLYTNTEEAIIQRKDILTKLNIGITDIIESCERKGDSSLDSKLDVIDRKDLGKLLQENPSITTLIYTSEFVKKQMNAAFNTYHSKTGDGPKRQSITLLGKKYEVVILYSPSPSALRGMGKKGAEKRLNQYKTVFSED